MDVRAAKGFIRTAKTAADGRECFMILMVVHGPLPAGFTNETVIAGHPAFDGKTLTFTVAAEEQTKEHLGKRADQVLCDL